MELVKMKITDIVPYDKNPRKNDHAVADVVQSIKDCEYIAPIIVDEDNIVLAGHTRLKALKRLKYKEVDVVVKAGLTEEQKRKYRILDNKTAEGAEWDFDLLADECIGLDFDDYSFDFDFGDDEQAEIIEGEVPEVDEESEPTAKLGDIWQLGRHRLMCGDSTNPEHVARLMDGTAVQMLYCDPPYGMGLSTDYSGMRGALNKNFTVGKKYNQGKVDDFDKRMLDVIFELNISETFLWGADYFAEHLADKNEGSWIVWDKRANNNDDVQADYSSDKMYGSCFELCWSKSKHKRDIARVKWAGVFGAEQEFDRKRYHPTQKPVKLSEWFISKYSKENDIIMDLFGGAGGVLIACEQLNRMALINEIDEKYCDVIIKRFENLTGETAVLVENILT